MRLELREALRGNPLENKAFAITRTEKAFTVF